MNSPMFASCVARNSEYSEGSTIVVAAALWCAVSAHPSRCMFMGTRTRKCGRARLAQIRVKRDRRRSKIEASSCLRETLAGTVKSQLALKSENKTKGNR